jgi:hypothetical protein
MRRNREKAKGKKLLSPVFENCKRVKNPMFKERREVEERRAISETSVALWAGSQV